MPLTTILTTTLTTTLTTILSTTYTHITKDYTYLRNYLFKLTQTREKPKLNIRERECWQKMAESGRRLAEGGRRLAEGQSHDFYTL